MKQNQFGRSMIEMLGVLAIIGVLTAGGVVGFNRAMSAYRWNMALGQWDTLVNMVVKYKAQLHINDGSQTIASLSLLPILEATGELPDNMQIKNCETLQNDCYIVDAMKNKIYIYSHNTKYVGIRSYYHNKNNYETCRLFMNMAKTNHNIIDEAEFYNVKPIVIFYGDSKCTKGREARCLKNLTISQINEICKDENIFKGNGLFLMYWF